MGFLKVLSDVDGVVADTSRRILEESGSHLRFQDVTEWDVLSLMNVEERERALAAMASPEFWSSLDVLDGAKRGIDHIVGMGHTLVWVTSPWAGCPEWDVVRRNWLKSHFGDHDVIITSAKKHISGDVFIDDKEANVLKWKKANLQGKAFLYDAPYNKNSSLPRVTWDQLRRIL